MYALLLAIALILSTAGYLEARVNMTQPQAIQTAFQDSPVERKTAFLTAAQIKQIESLAGVKTTSSIVCYYVGKGSSGPTGIAFFDRRIVRTMPVTYMVVVKPSGILDRVEILSFEEPDDYFPTPRWLQLYRNRALNNHLEIGQDIPHITGASLTSQTMNDGIRLALATFQVAVKNTL